MQPSRTYTEITRIRADLLDLIGELSASSRRFDRRASLIQDELLMASNTLGRIAGELAQERTLSLVNSTD
jgi:hypothetical protein